MFGPHLTTILNDWKISIRICIDEENEEYILSTEQIKCLSNKTSIYLNRIAF